MAKGLFTVGFTVQDVLDIQAKAKADMKRGQTITSYSVAGASFSKSQVAPVMEILDECRYALQVLDPARFGAPRNIVRTSWRNFNGY
jgi:hypothetical protein